MNPYLVEVRATNANLMEVNAMKRSIHRITSSIQRKQEIRRGQIVALDPLIQGVLHEAVAHHRGAFRFLLWERHIRSGRHGHDHASARRYLAAGERSRYTGRRDRNPDGGCSTLITCSQFAAELPDRRKRHGVLDLGNSDNFNVRIALQL
jgi:hypothetical protein